MDRVKIQQFVNDVWDNSIIGELTEYIRIPNKSPHFDPARDQHGYMEDAVQQIYRWCAKRAITGMNVEIVRLPGRTPLIFMEIPGASDATVLLYGHLDKQPEMTGWRDGLGPWTPVREGDRLFGRGGADDGYSAFASLTAIEALDKQGLPHARCVVVIEACEESGSYDLPYYIDALADRIGAPDLVICLDSGCGNYDQLWCTTSLRGMTGGVLTVKVLDEGVHSGDASGIVPSPFRIARQLLGRIEDDTNGRVHGTDFHVEIPDQRLDQAAKVAAVLGSAVYDKFPLKHGVLPDTTDHIELVLNRTWRPALSVTGVAGLPAIPDAGNVTVPEIALKLSLRLPPTCDAQTASTRLGEILTAERPNHAQVDFKREQCTDGWNAPALATWLETATNNASLNFFGRDAVYMGEGGSIPFMGMLGEKFPQAQFMITGVLGPHSNAHGPNEFLDIPTGKKVTSCVAEVLHAHYEWLNAR